MYGHLKELRESLGLTQSEFGKSIGVAKSTYNNYETGIREPKSDFWISVAQQYGVTIDYLMGYSNDPHAISDNKKSPSVLDEDPADIAELKSIYNSLNDAGRAQLMVQARQIANYGDYQATPRQSKRA